MPGLPGPEAGEAGGGEEGLCVQGGKESEGGKPAAGTRQNLPKPPTL